MDESKINWPKEFSLKPSELLAQYDADLFFYNGPVIAGAARMLLDAITKRQPRHRRAALLITTFGGDLHEAFRIARSLLRFYDEFTILLGGVCASAGTLIATGAKEIAFGPLGELGPMDVQIPQKDEVAQWQSGLDTAEAFAALQGRSFDAFEAYLLRVLGGGGQALSTTTSAKIATSLVSGLIQPIAAHLNPSRMAEVDRQLRIAEMYAQRLATRGKNIDSEAIKRLVHDYPAHEFVIDMEEADSLFQRIRDMDLLETTLALHLGDQAVLPSGTSARVAAYEDFITNDVPLKLNQQGADNESPGQVDPSNTVAPFDSATEGGEVAAPTKPPKPGSKRTRRASSRSGTREDPGESAA